MNDLISKGKLIRDLRGIYDILTGAGDPFLASMINKAIECVERQPIVLEEKESVEAAITDDVFGNAILLLEKEYQAAQHKPHVNYPLAYALYQVWKKVDSARV